MSNYTDNFGLVLNGSRDSSALSMSKTFWGYNINSSPAAHRRAGIGELLAGTGCLFFCAASFAQWLVPGAIDTSGVLPLQVSGTIVFFSLAAFLYRIARRGLSTEVQVDTKRRVVRLARRNRRGTVTPTRSIQFCEIESVFIRRSQSAAGSNQLYIRSGASAQNILITSGPAPELEALLDRLQCDFKAQDNTMVIRPRRVVPKPISLRPRSVLASG